jgi:dolichol-phosphate mannosyltransferase
VEEGRVGGSSIAISIFVMAGVRSEKAAHISIVIPCHNEEIGLSQIGSQLGPVLGELSAKDPVEVVFVDDGSTDATWERLTMLAEDARLCTATIRLRRHEINLGLGAALRTGFAAARGRVIVTTDSDGTYRFNEIPVLLEKLTPSVDVVTASPYHPQGGVAGVPPYRLILSRGSSFLYRLLVGGSIHTYTALFRAYRADVVRNVAFQSNGFLAVAELLVNAILSGYRVAEYPTTLHVRVAGVSKAKLVRTIAAHLRYQFGVLRHQMGVSMLKLRRTVA